MSRPLEDIAPRDAGARDLTLNKTRALIWSVRRELWEHRSVTIAPCVVAGLVLLAFLFELANLPQKFRGLEDLAPADRRFEIVEPYSTAPAPIMITALLVGFFFALDALYGERRDRSILFWKSLPVSDRLTVIAKALIPLGVLPIYALALSVATFFLMLFLSTAVLGLNGISPALLWKEVNFVQEPLVMLYGLVVHALWLAPITCWLLLLSAWARRTPLLWVVLPPVVIMVFERIMFRTSFFAGLIRYRLGGALEEAFVISRVRDAGGNINRLWQLDPLRFLTSPGLWLGLLFAAICLGLAVRLRRHRDPI